MKAVYAILLVWLISLTGCADIMKFERAGYNDVRMERIATVAIQEEQKTARAALGYSEDKNGLIRSLKENGQTPSCNPFNYPEPTGDALLINNLLNEAATHGLIPPRSLGNKNGNNVSLFSGPIVNSTIQINTGAASKQTKGSGGKEYSLGSIAQSAVNRIGRPVKTDAEIGIEAGMGVLKAVAYPFAGAYVLKEAFRAAGNKTHLNDSMNQDNSDNSVDNSVSEESTEE